MVPRFLHHTPYKIPPGSILPIEMATPTDVSFYWQNMVISRDSAPPAALDFEKQLALLRDVPVKTRAELTAAMPRSGIPIIDEWLSAVASGDWPNEAEFKQKFQSFKIDSEPKKECLFESIRALHFPESPSRMRCLFALDLDLDLDEHMRAMKFSVTDRMIVEIEPVAGARTLRVNSSFLDCTGMNLEEQKHNATMYWQGTAIRSISTEVLIEGGYRITRVLRTPNH